MWEILKDTFQIWVGIVVVLTVIFWVVEWVRLWRGKD